MVIADSEEDFNAPRHSPDADRLLDSIVKQMNDSVISTPSCSTSASANRIVPDSLGGEISTSNYSSIRTSPSSLCSMVSETPGSDCSSVRDDLDPEDHIRDSKFSRDKKKQFFPFKKLAFGKTLSLNVFQRGSTQKLNNVDKKKVCKSNSESNILICHNSFGDSNDGSPNLSCGISTSASSFYLSHKETIRSGKRPDFISSRPEKWQFTQPAGCAQKYKLMNEGDVQVCKVKHGKNFVDKMISSTRLLRRWETHHLYLEDNSITSKTVSN